MVETVNIILYILHVFLSVFYSYVYAMGYVKTCNNKVILRLSH